MTRHAQHTRAPVFPMRLVSFLVRAAVIPGLSACARVEPRADFERAAQHVSAAVGIDADTTWPTSDETDVEEDVRRMIAAGLTADDAARVCLMSKPELRVEFARLGMARADVVESGLWSNPRLALALRLPDEGGLANVMVDVAQNISDLWRIGIRRRSAEAEMDRAILDAARRISLAVLEVREKYYAAVAANLQRDVAQSNLQVARLLLDAALARQQVAGGNAVEVNLARAEVLENELAVRNAELKGFNARRELAGAMGWEGPPDELILLDDLPDAIAPEAPLDAVVQLAQTTRLDLQAAQAVVARSEAELDLQRRRVFPSLEIGLSAEREARPRGRNTSYLKETVKSSLQAGELSPAPFGRSARQGETFVLGPTLSLELPVFNQNQAGIARAWFALREAANLREALRRTAVQEVRGAYERLRISRINVRFFQEHILPLREQTLDLSREGYRAGKTPFSSVLDAQRELLRARGEWIGARSEAAAAGTELERAVGLPLAVLRERCGAIQTHDESSAETGTISEEQAK